MRDRLPGYDCACGASSSIWDRRVRGVTATHGGATMRLPSPAGRWVVSPINSCVLMQVDAASGAALADVGRILPSRTSGVAPHLISRSGA